MGSCFCFLTTLLLLICHCWTGLNLLCITLGKSYFFLKKANTPPDKPLKEEYSFARIFPEEARTCAMCSWIKTQKYSEKGQVM